VKLVYSVFLGASIALVSGVAHAKSAAERYLDGELPLSTEFTYDGPPITIRYSTFLGSAGAAPDNYRAMWERLAQDTNGKILFEPYWSSSLTDTQTGAFEAINSGLADMGTCYTQMNPGGFDLHFGIQLPTLFSDSSVGTLVFNEVYARYLRDEYERRGVYLARTGLTPPQQLYSKEPIRTLADMAGKRAWASGTVAVQSVGALGLEPTTLRISEMYSGFQTGVLDAVPMHDAGVHTFRINEIARYRTEVGLWTNPNEHCVNKETWDALPENVQDYLYHWLQIWTQVESQLYYDAEAERARSSLPDDGIEFIELSEADKAEVQERYAAVIAKWIADQEAAGRPGDELVATMRELAERYSSMTADERLLMLIEAPIPGMMTGH
jgi:TRAP-type transport system periplasmic protein